MNNIPTAYCSLESSEHLKLITVIRDSIAGDKDAAVARALSAKQNQELQRRLSAHKTDPYDSIPSSEAYALLEAQKSYAYFWCMDRYEKAAYRAGGSTKRSQPTKKDTP